ncbi:MAG: hypothetical protein ACYC5H_19030 [Methylovirgula sp.]
MQIGKALVEVRRVVGSPVVPTLEASWKVELQAGLEAEGDRNPS